MMSWPIKLALIGLATAAYLALAVIGWGGPAAFFSHPARVALPAVVVALAVASCFVGGNLSSGTREDRGNRWVLAAFAVIGALNAWLPAYAERQESWTFGGDAVRWLGVALFAV